jgi:hypothetical protein
MLVTMKSKITIGKLVFNNLINNVEVDSGRKCLTQTATIKMPRFNQLVDSSASDYKIKTGDAVKIELGYDNKLFEEFTGYVSEVSPKSPLEIKCEDEMWLLKQSTVTMSWKSITLKNLLAWLVPSVNILQCPEVTLSPFSVSYVTKFKVLQKLKDEYGLDVYFRKGKLFVGLAYTETGLNKVVYNFQKNVPKEEVDKNLFFRKKDDAKLRVKAISILPDNKRIETEVGDKDGDQTTLTFYNIKTKDELRKQATELINKQKFDGYRGSIKCFGVPYATFGMVARFIDERYKERQGDYFIDQVKVSYGSDGYRREIFPGRKANSAIIQ